MTDTLLSSIPGISHSQQSALKKGGLVTVSDVLLFPFSDVSQRCRLAPQAVQEIVDSIARELGRPPSLLSDVVRNGSEVITTGDAALDEMLGGGIRVGMIWEFVGEGAAGKTQLALQLSLLVQLPVAQGGLDGSACYLTTSASLPTPRLLQLLHEHPLLARSRCSLDNIQTSATKSVSSLLFALSEVLPASINAAAAAAANKTRSSKPLRLLVIDSLAEVLLEDTKMSTATLADRSRNLSAIAAQLHALATTHQLAVVAINRVTDVWDRHPDAVFRGGGELLYADHARIFGRAEGGAKSAALGLVWANQVNARIMLALTERRHAHAHRDGTTTTTTTSSGGNGSAVPLVVEGHDPEWERERKRKRKRLRAEEGVGAAVVRADDVVVRRLTVVFSSVCAPASVDFVVTSRGVETLTEVVDLDTCHAYVSHSHSHLHPAATAAVSAERPPLADVSPLDVGSVMSQFRLAEPGDVPVAQVEDDDDDDAYWREVDDFPFASDNIDDQVQATDPMRFS